MASLGWTTLVVCAMALLVRVPDAIRGRNRTVFGILLLATVCSLLSISGPYEALDRQLGGWNLTNLILRFLVFATMLLVGRRVAKGLTAVSGARLIAGTTGRWALGLSCLAVAGIFLTMDTRGSSAGLLDIADRGGRNAILAPYYAAAGRSYPAFVSLVLLPPLLATARSRLPRLVRAGALLMAIGALCAALSLPASLAPDDWDLAQHALNYAAVLGYVLGLVLFWFSGLIAQAPRNFPATPQPQGLHRKVLPRRSLHKHRLDRHSPHRNSR